MFKTGICSITFRQFGVEEIVSLVKKAGLDAVEWGGDLHVKPGDIAAAETARKTTLDGGLEVSSYGSYYRVLDENEEQVFEPVLESALALGTDTIRIWPGSRPSETVEETWRKQFVEKLRDDLDRAAAVGVRLALEFHVGSLTDSNASAQRLLEEVNHPNLYLYWQPIYWLADSDYRFQGLENLRDRILNLHVFNWNFYPYNGNWSTHSERRPLAEAEAEWTRYLSVPLSEGIHYALMEFVRDNDPERFLEDARVLRQWVGEANEGEVQC